MSDSPKGFTLVELMIVIAIIGILAAALFPSLTGYLARARDTRRVQDISKIAATLTLYEIDHGYMKKTYTYGGNDSGAWDFSSQPTNNPQFLKYIGDAGYEKIPTDPINTGDMMNISGFGQFPGNAYFYYCYSIGDQSGTIQYDQYVLGARLEQALPTGSQKYIGSIVTSNATLYYFTKWHEGKTNATSCR